MFKNLIYLIFFAFILFQFLKIDAKLCRFVYTIKNDEESCEDIRQAYNVTIHAFEELNPKFNCTEIQVRKFLLKKS